MGDNLTHLERCLVTACRPPGCKSITGDGVGQILGIIDRLNNKLQQYNPVGNWTDHKDYHTIEFEYGQIMLTPRPAYCNRGDYIAHLQHSNIPDKFWVSDADLWPKYLFGLNQAKCHCEEWLRRHGVGIPQQSIPFTIPSITSNQWVNILDIAPFEVPMDGKMTKEQWTDIAYLCLGQSDNLSDTRPDMETDKMVLDGVEQALESVVNIEYHDGEYHITPNTYTIDMKLPRELSVGVFSSDGEYTDGDAKIISVSVVRGRIRFIVATGDHQTTLDTNNMQRIANTILSNLQ